MSQTLLYIMRMEQIISRANLNFCELKIVHHFAIEGIDVTMISGQGKLTQPLIISSGYKYPLGMKMCKKLNYNIKLWLDNSFEEKNSLSSFIYKKSYNFEVVMKQKNINFLIGGTFYYTMRYVFPLVKYLVLYFWKQMAAHVFMPKNDYI